MNLGEAGQKLAELQAERSQIDRILTNEDVKDAAREFIDGTTNLLDGRTPSVAIAHNYGLLLEQRLDIVARHVIQSDGFRDWLLAEIAGSDQGAITRKSKNAKLADLDKQIEAARSEYNRLRVVEAKREAEQRVKDEIAGLEQQLAAETA